MNSAEAALARATWQRVLFAEPNRADLAECVPSWKLQSLRVRVHRNHGFEPVSAAASAFAAWNGLAFEWAIGAYDDSLSFGLDAPADIDVVWLDTRRITHRNPDDAARWLTGRLQALRAQTSNPIVVLAWPLTPVQRATITQANVPGLWIGDLDLLATALGDRWLDPRTETLSGTALGNRACLHVARELACCWLPAAALPPRKAIVVDADDTLYRGVLAEDGPDGIALTDAHRALQRRLLDLRRAGVLLALVSRNAAADIEALFARRADFPLRLADFAAIDISWDDRAAAVDRVARQLRIAPDAMVLIDDNPGELAHVAAALPVLTVHAQMDATATAMALDHAAGIFRWRETSEDQLRAADLSAIAERATVAASAHSPDDYLRSLAVELEFIVGPREHLVRLAALASKTNQFNLSLRRMNETQILHRIDERASNVVAIRLADRLSDSGIVGLVVGSRSDDTVSVDELCVSCRALGRRLEDSMLTIALRLLAGEPAPARITFSVRNGPRNEPARDWLRRYANVTPADDTHALDVPFERVAATAIPSAIRTRVVQ